MKNYGKLWRNSRKWYEQNANINKEIENPERNKKELGEMKSTITEMKTSLGRLKADFSNDSLRRKSQRTRRWDNWNVLRNRKKVLGIERKKIEEKWTEP